MGPDPALGAMVADDPDDAVRFVARLVPDSDRPRWAVALPHPVEDGVWLGVLLPRGAEPVLLTAEEV